VKRGALVALMMLAPCGPTSTASAHLGHEVKRAERYLKLDLREREVRLVVTLTLGETEGEALMRAADDDGDRRVSELEAERHLEAWAAALGDELILTAGGERVALTFGDGFFDPKGPVRRVVATLEMVGRGRLPSGVYPLELEDRMANRNVFERTDVILVATPPVEILGDGFGEPERPPRGAYAFSPERAPERISLEVRSPARALWKLVRVIFIGAMVMVGLGLHLYSRRRRRRGPLGDPAA
jgi:hypothetical protein